MAFQKVRRPMPETMPFCVDSLNGLVKVFKFWYDDTVFCAVLFMLVAVAFDAKLTEEFAV